MHHKQLVTESLFWITMNDHLIYLQKISHVSPIYHLK